MVEETPRSDGGEVAEGIRTGHIQRVQVGCCSRGFEDRYSQTLVEEVGKDSRVFGE